MHVQIPWSLGKMEFASFSQAAGVTLLTLFTLDPAACEKDYDISLYILPVLIILRSMQ